MFQYSKSIYSIRDKNSSSLLWHYIFAQQSASYSTALTPSKKHLLYITKAIDSFTMNSWRNRTREVKHLSPFTQCLFKNMLKNTISIQYKYISYIRHVVVVVLSNNSPQTPHTPPQSVHYEIVASAENAKYVPKRKGAKGSLNA